jgi:hypothetical protein
MMFNHRNTPWPVLAIAGSLCLGAASAVLIGLMTLPFSDGFNGHGVPPWFLLIILAFGLICLGGAVCFVSVPMALALLVNCKSTRTRRNIVLIAFGCLYAFGATVVFVSRLAA